MEKRILFWASLAIFTTIIIGVVYYVSVLSLERLIPIECDVTEEWLHEKTDFTIVQNFLAKYPNAEFDNRGHEDSRPEYCTYVFSGNTDQKVENLKIHLDKNREILKASIFEFDK